MPDPTVEVKALSSEWEISEDAAGKVTGRTVWQITSSAPCTPYTAKRLASSAGLPIRADSYPTLETVDEPTSSAYCVKITVRAVDQTRMLFRAECDYDSTIYAFPGSPLSEPAKISAAGESYEETFFADKTPTDDFGPKYAKNTAGAPFPELPKRDAGLTVYTIEKNVDPTTTDATVEALNNTVNDANVTLNGRVWPAGTLRVTAWSLSEVKRENGIDYKTRSYTVKAKRDGWDQKYESLGLEEIIDGINWPIINPGTGAPTTEPWPLGEEGNAYGSRDLAGFEIVLKPYDKATYGTSLTA